MESADNEPRLKKTCKKTRPEPQPVQKKGNKKRNPRKSFVAETECPPSPTTSSPQAGPSTSSASATRSTPHVIRRRLLTSCEPQDPPDTVAPAVPAAPAAPIDGTASSRGSRYNTRSSTARRRRGAAHTPHTPPVSAQQLRPPAPVARRAPPARCHRHAQTELLQLTNEEVELIHAVRQKSITPKLCPLNVIGTWFFIYNPEYNGNYNQQPRTIREYINWELLTGSSASRNELNGQELFRYTPEGVRQALSQYLTSTVTRMYPHPARDHDAVDNSP